MTERAFIQLNETWNAEPNAPEPLVQVDGSRIELKFLLNSWVYDAAANEIGQLSFEGCSKWRLGGTNDEGWYRGQCRYSWVAPSWGEFYEIVGLDPLAHSPLDWKTTGQDHEGQRHFLFYLRDETFECFATQWEFSRHR